MKPTSDSSTRATSRTVERRSFIWNAGAALSATVASAAAMASGGAPRATSDAKELERLAHQLGVREDADAIRQLHRSFASALNERRYEDVISLFADDAEVHFNNTVFAGKASVRRLYVERFGQRFTDPTPEPVHAGVADSTAPCRIDVAPDRQSATARFPCLTQVEAALEGHSPLVEMARQQGQGFVHSWEHGLYENAYVKRGAEWKILQLRYSAMGSATSGA